LSHKYVAALRNAYWQFLSVLRMFCGRTIPVWLRYARVTLNGPAGKPTTGGSNKKLLLITWEFPPQVTGGVYRPLSFARHAASFGWQVEVVCGPAPFQPSEAGRYLAGLLPDTILLHRVEADAGPHPWFLPKVDGGIVNALTLYEAAATRIPPGESGVILASGPPFANFIAGLWLARRTGWRLVLDYRDEWTETPFKFVERGGANHDWESLCLERANLVIYTTPSQRAHAEQRFPALDKARCAVVYNGWEPDDFTESPVCKKRDSTTSITLAYLGNLGAMAAPDSFLATLAGVLAARPDLRARVKVRVVGHKRPDALQKLNAFPYPETIELVDPISKVEACRMMREIDGLLLFNPPELKRYIQGKLYEYIASCTPILAFGAGGEMGEIINRLGAGITVPENDAESLAHALEGLRTYQLGDSDVRDAWLASRRRVELAGGLYRELNALLAPQKTG
jgi:glycosyltransferase involved in cell wall biosynthesis